MRSVAAGSKDRTTEIGHFQILSEHLGQRADGAYPTVTDILRYKEMAILTYTTSRDEVLRV